MVLNASPRLPVHRDEVFQQPVKPFIEQRPQAIIYQDDEASRLLAEECQKELLTNGISLPLELIAGSDIENYAERIDTDAPLLIVAAIISRGNLLQSIARDLRDCHTGVKIYLIGLQLAQASSEIVFCVTNLKQAKIGKNTVSAYRALAVGRALQLSFGDEEKVYREDAHIARRLSERVEILSGRLAASPEMSLLYGTEGAMQLRRDFVYWNSSYIPAPEHAALVLLTIGAVLQFARDGDFDSPNHWLKSNAIQQVVLDPLLFMRFNDGIIQSAILRQAYPSELDYSSLPDESGLIRTIIEGQILYKNRAQGEAALEFALALKTGKLKLTKIDDESIRQFAEKKLTASNFDKLLSLFFNPHRDNDSFEDL